MKHLSKIFKQAGFLSAVALFASLFVAPSAFAAVAITEYSAGITASSRPTGITAGADGNLWFAEGAGNQIGKITTGGAVTEYSAGITAGSEPVFITAGPDDNLWFTEAADRIGVVSGLSIPVGGGSSNSISSSSLNTKAPDTGYGQPAASRPLITMLITGTIVSISAGLTLFYKQNRVKNSLNS